MFTFKFTCKSFMTLTAVHPVRFSKLLIAQRRGVCTHSATLLLTQGVSCRRSKCRCTALVYPNTTITVVISWKALRSHTRSLEASGAGCAAWAGLPCAKCCCKVCGARVQLQRSPGAAQPGAGDLRLHLLFSAAQLRFFGARRDH